MSTPAARWNRRIALGAPREGLEKVDEGTRLSLGLSKNPEEILSAGIFQQPIRGEAELQTLFEEVRAGL